MFDVAVLFVMKDSIYKTFPNVDCYDEQRDALTYPGGLPIIAHPPCRLWGRLYKFSTAPNEEKKLAIFAINQARKFGGIVEHPAYSKLWKSLNLPLPGKEIDDYGGFTIDIDQHWFGHLAQKRTWLYICGIDKKNIPPVEMNLNAITHVISTSKKGRYENKRYNYIPKSQRSATPEAFAIWLINIAKDCKL